MGCDGGTIPRRDEMVKLKKKAEKVRPSVTNLCHWPSIAYNVIAQNFNKACYTYATRHMTHRQTILAG